jgi:mycothiol synthase
MTKSESPQSPRAEFLSSAPSWLPSLISRSLAVDGQPPFSDQALVDVRTGVRRVLALGAIGAALVGDGSAELVIDPDARGRGYGTSLLEAVVAHSQPGLLVWAHGDPPAARALAASHGFVAVRTLLKLELNEDPKRPFRLDVPVPPGTSSRMGFIQGFRRGTDDAAWLALNARAFATHPEQGRVTQRDLDELFAEPWFDAEDFLLLWDGETLIGYCWLKVNDPPSDKQSGEFYVVGVDPERQGEGLGRRLVRGGLARLDERGIRSASLYVEADNEPALALYRAFGFEQSSIDVQYRREPELHVRW